MKSNWKFSLLLVYIMALPALYLAWLWPDLPERIVTHWGFDGQPDRYGPKSSLIALVALVVVLPNLLMWLVPHIDPKHKLQPGQASYTRIQLVIAVSMSVLAIVILRATAHPQTDVTQWIAVTVGLMLAALGNYLTSVKPNYFVGIRTPWTLENETVWRKTHQLGGRLFFWCGLAMAVAGLLLPDPWRVLAMLAVLPASIVPIVYSYRVFQQTKNGAH